MTEHRTQSRAELRDLTRTRSSGLCEACLAPLGWRWELHHRRLLSQGGPDCLCNVLALHSACHNQHARQESVHQQPKLARANGLMVSAHGDGPEVVPVRLGALVGSMSNLGPRALVLLSCDGPIYTPGVVPTMR